MMKTIILSDKDSGTEQTVCMTKSPLSSSGVQGKIEELYALNDVQISREADAVQANFKSWLLRNFFLSPKQRAYLANLNQRTANYFGSQCAICFSSKLPIELVYPFPPETDYSKWTGSSNSLIVKSGAEERAFATGKLVFEFSYAATIA